MSNCFNNNCNECDNCESNEPSYVNTGCPDGQQAHARCVDYNGPNGQCVPFVAGESIESIITKIDNKICDFIAGSDRLVSVDPSDAFPGSLQDKIVDSTYIKWQVITVAGIRKYQAYIDVNSLAAEVCNFCNTNTSTTTTSPVTSSTTTLPAPTTTTSTTSTTTLPPNVLVQSYVANSSIVSVSGVTGFTLPQTVEQGEIIGGRHNSFNTSIAVLVNGFPTSKSLILRRNGIILECINVNGSGTYTFSPVAFILTDIVSIEYVDEACAVATTSTTTTTPATTSTTTTLPVTTTTTRPINVVVQSSVSGTSITSVGGVSGFNLPESVEAGEVITGYHNFFNNAISVTVFGVVSGAKMVLFKNGIEVQCLDVNGQGTVTFNSVSFNATDTLTIVFSPVPCTPASSTSTTTTLQPCRTYRVTNTTGTTINFTYSACNGATINESIAAGQSMVICALNNSISNVVGLSVQLLNTACFDCFTYSVVNISGVAQEVTYVSCEGTPTNIILSSGGSITLCARNNSVAVSGGTVGVEITVTEVQYGCNPPATTTTSTTTTLPATTTSTTTTLPATTTSTTTTFCCDEYTYTNGSGTNATLNFTDCQGVPQTETVAPGNSVTFCALCGTANPSSGIVLNVGTCTETPPIAKIYYGTLGDGNTPTEGEILGMSVKFENPTDVTVLNWGTQSPTPVYYVFAVPATFTNKAYWYQSVLNQGNIGTPSDLFDAPATVTVDGVSYKVYITEYATQFVNNANYVFSVNPYTP